MPATTIIQPSFFGFGVSAQTRCARCNRLLTAAESVQAEIGPVCRAHIAAKEQGETMSKFEDKLDPTPLTEKLVMRREGDKVVTNVPHLVTHHSPLGYEFGYSGSGPADLALNVCEWFLKHTGYTGERTLCYKGKCFSLAWVLHQDFKRTFVASAQADLNTVDYAVMEGWFKRAMTPELIAFYKEAL